MGLFTRTKAPTQQATATAVADTPTVEVPVPPLSQKSPEPLRPFGAQSNGMTRFGNMWLNLDDCSSIEFDPPDGCGAEIRFKGSDEEWHMTDEDAAALKAYFEGIERAQRAVAATKSGT